MDLGDFSDADGLPEMAWMALDGTHLFIQIQRIDRIASGTTVRPALLAVVDIAARELIDVDPMAGGIQGMRYLEEDRESARLQIGLEWDGRDELGRAVGSGVYTVRATSGSSVASRSIVRLR